MCITVAVAQGSRLEIAADVGLNLSTFVAYDGAFHEPGTKPGMEIGFSFAHKVAGHLGLRYQLAYQRKNPRLLDLEGVEGANWDPVTGRIVSSGETLFNSQDYALDAISVSLQPEFSFFFPERRIGVLFGVGFGMSYCFRVNHVSENFGNPIETTARTGYNKFDFPVLGSLDVLFRVSDRMVLSFGNGICVGTHELDGSTDAGGNFFAYPAYRMVGYEGKIRLSVGLSDRE